MRICEADFFLIGTEISTFISFELNTKEAENFQVEDCLFILLERGGILKDNWYKDNETWFYQVFI